MYDGLGQSAFQINNPAPWQDDFLTWNFSYLAELGFDKAEPILRWKANYPVGRMTAPGFCWIKAASYTLAIRPAGKALLFTSLEQVYRAHVSGESISNEGKTVTHPRGLRCIDQPCASRHRPTGSLPRSISAGAWAAWTAMRIRRWLPGQSAAGARRFGNDGHPECPAGLDHLRGLCIDTEIRERSTAGDQPALSNRAA